MGIAAGAVFLIALFQLASLISVFFIQADSIEPGQTLVPGATLNEGDSLSEFDKKIKVRNLFFSSAPAAARAPLIGIKDKVKDLALIGIVKTGAMEAILKEKNSGKTTFVKAGQRFGDLEVKMVKESSVILKFKDEENELFLS